MQIYLTTAGIGLKRLSRKGKTRLAEFKLIDFAVRPFLVTIAFSITITTRDSIVSVGVST